MEHPYSYQGKLNIKADMLTCIASVTPVEEYILPEEVPTPWSLDGINPQEAVQAQKEEFSNEPTEACQDMDDCPYVLQNGLLYSIAEPYRNAGRYPRLVCLIATEKLSLIIVIGR